MFNGSTTFTISNKWYYGNDTQLFHKGSMFEQPDYPDLVPPEYIVPCARPYGYVGMPHEGTDELIFNGVHLGYFDQRLMHAPSPVSGEAFMHNDTYTHAMRVNGVKVYREDGFQTWLTSADNTQSLLRSIYIYLMTIAQRLEKLQAWAYTHKHTYTKPEHPAGDDDTTTPNTTAAPPSGSSYTNNQPYSDLVKGHNYNEAGQTKIKDSTDLITDL
jgi:hypothetical protein